MRLRVVIESTTIQEWCLWVVVKVTTIHKESFRIVAKSTTIQKPLIKSLSLCDRGSYKIVYLISVRLDRFLRLGGLGELFQLGGLVLRRLCTVSVVCPLC